MLHWYNTLAAPNRDDFWTRIPEIIAAAGGTPNEQVLHEWEAGHPLEHQQRSVSETTYREWQRQRFVRLLEQSGVSEPERSRVTAEVERVRHTRVFTVFSDVMEVLTALRDQGLVVGICSNWDWDLDRHLRHNEIQARVDFVVCSAVHGHRKPHPAIFDSVVSSAGLPTTSTAPPGRVFAPYTSIGTATVHQAVTTTYPASLGFARCWSSLAGDLRPGTRSGRRSPNVSEDQVHAG